MSPDKYLRLGKADGSILSANNGLQLGSSSCCRREALLEMMSVKNMLIKFEVEDP